MTGRRPDLHEAPFAPVFRAPEQVTRREFWLAVAFLGIGFVFRLFYAWHYPIDSDEPQHLHVVWTWARGLLPYRDEFDNHSPLFQTLYAPLFRLLGERADILLPMRVAELPLFALTIYCVWKIAAALYSPRTALWTAVLTALFPPFYLSSIEFRPDQLWTLVWLLMLLVLGTGRITVRRALLAGVLCGVAFSVSMKSTLLLAALAQAGLGAILVRRVSGGFPLVWPRLLRCAGAGLVGIVIVPAVIVLFFYGHGAQWNLYYGVIEHNILPSGTAHAVGFGALKRWVPGVLMAAAGGYIIVRLERPIVVRTRISFIFFAALLYLETLRAIWPVITAEDYLPFYPAMMLTAAPALLWLAQFALHGMRFPTGAALAGVEVISFLALVSPFQDKTGDKIGMVADTLKLTAPGDYVMDSKGESIYRRRPYYYVFESLTNHRVKEGKVKDDIAAHLISTRTPLAASNFRMPHKGRTFIKENYVPIAWRLRVLGKFLRKEGEKTAGPCTFDVAVPQRYTLITLAGTPAGTLDGTPFTGPRELSAGQHTFVPSAPTGRLVLIWAKALEQGYSPFARIKEDYKSDRD